MTSIKARAWNAFAAVIRKCFGSKKAKNYKELVHDLLSRFEAIGCKMNVKPH